MDILIKRMIHTGSRSRLDLLGRLDFWADRYHWWRDADEDDVFIYKRGSQWSAFYTFDIRKVPTEVHIELVPDSGGLCMCTMHCASWLQYTTAGDAARLSEQMDLLEACLKLALGEQSRIDGAVAENPPRESAPSSHHVKPA